jgi:hypothetical protein
MLLPKNPDKRSDADRVVAHQNEFVATIQTAVEFKDRVMMIAAFRELKRKAGSTEAGMQSRRTMRRFLLAMWRHWRGQ